MICPQGVTDAKLILYAALIARHCRRRRPDALWRAACILIGASRAIEYDIRNAFFCAPSAAAAGVSSTRNRTGDLMSRATNDLSAVRMMVGPAVLYASSTGLTFVVARRA